MKKCFVCGKEIKGECYFILRIYYPKEMHGFVLCSKECVRRQLDNMLDIDEIKRLVDEDP